MINIKIWIEKVRMVNCKKHLGFTLLAIFMLFETSGSSFAIGLRHLWSLNQTNVTGIAQVGEALHAMVLVTYLFSAPPVDTG
jgi:hypothetical protein